VELPTFLNFDPVPVRGRHDSWSRRVERRLILRLACGDGPAEAARRLGAAGRPPTLRDKAGAEGFAAAWDAAQAFAAQAGLADRSARPLNDGLETIFVPRFYRGKLVGYAQREDPRSALRTLQRLDRVSALALADRSFDFDHLVERAATASAEADKADDISV
jgi:hypothetical protein